MLPRWSLVGVIAIAGIAAPRSAEARTEINARIPVGVAIGDGARFELGLRSDLLYLFESSHLRLGIAGEVRSVSVSQRAQEVGAAIAKLGDGGGGCWMGPMLDAGFGSEGERRYLFGRVSYQVRVAVPDRGTRLAHTLSSGIVLGLRRNMSGPGGFEGIIGVEIGGGLIATMARIAQSFG